MKELVVLKLGGSVITEKDRVDYTVRKDLLRKIFSHIYTVHTNNSDLRIAFVHGAGGYIHNLAHEYELHTGSCGDSQKQKGSILAQNASVRLNTDIVALLQDSGIPARAICTHEVVQNSSGKIVSMDLHEIQKNINDNYVSIVHGDMVADDVLEFSICSGDALVSHLATSLSAERILFATDVDGIYTSNPHTDPDAKLLEKLTLEDLNSDSISLTGSHNIDTTGGLKGKLDACKNLFKKTPTLQRIEIFNGLEAENFKKVFTGQSFEHTTLSP